MILLIADGLWFCMQLFLFLLLLCVIFLHIYDERLLLLMLSVSVQFTGRCVSKLTMWAWLINTSLWNVQIVQKINSPLRFIVKMFAVAAVCSIYIYIYIHYKPNIVASLKSSHIQVTNSLMTVGWCVRCWFWKCVENLGSKSPSCSRILPKDYRGHFFLRHHIYLSRMNPRRIVSNSSWILTLICNFWEFYLSVLRQQQKLLLVYDVQ